MTAYFSEFMQSQMAAGYNWTGQTMGVVLLYRAAVPLYTGGNSANPTLHTPYDLNGLLADPGFQEVDTSVCPTYKGAGSLVTQTVNQTPAPPVTPGTAITVIYGSDWQPIPVGAGAQPVFVQAALFYVVGTVGGVTNPWVMITDQPFNAVVYPGVRITGSPRNLFSYIVRGTTADLASAAVLSEPGTLTWETARLTHVYLIPQRINYIPNPSFEEVNNFGWRSDGAMTRQTGGVDNPANHYVHTAGLVLESIYVPFQGQFRLSAYVRSTTATVVALGVACYDETYHLKGDGTPGSGYVMGPQHPIYPTWTRYDQILEPQDDTAVVVPHIATDVGGFDCDLVLMEASDRLNPYWDGDSQTGLTGDFTWQSNQAKSYSCWYNNRNLNAARLFGMYTTGPVAAPGLVFDWLPTGSVVFTHWDVLSQFDTKHPLEDWGSRLIT